MAADLTGTEILGYRLEELLGEGGMGSVWRGRNPLLDTVVAVKVMNPMLAQDEVLVQRFADEARIQLRLQHPNIVKLENLTVEPLAMVMEFVPGRPLSRVIGREVGPIPLERAMPMIRQLLGAVAHAHDVGVVHRDLKPSNVLVTPEGEVKVMDFGIAKVLGRQGRTRTGATLGTPAYMAPEQIRGARNVDTRADIYALGITIYEMLSGRPPFEPDPDEDGDYGLMEAQIHQQPPDPREFYPAIPCGVVGVLMTALAKKPDQRQQSADEMLQVLEAAVARGDTEEVPPPEALMGVPVCPRWTAPR